MKIFLSFLQSKNQYNISGYSFWDFYIKNGIEEAGFTWCECDNADWTFGILNKPEEEHKKWKSEIWDKTLKTIRHEKPDMFLSYLYPQMVDDNAVQLIKNLGIPCVNFYCDNVRHFKKIPKEFRIFDLNWVPEFKSLGIYKNAGIPFLNLPMPMWVTPENRVPNFKETERISFIGSYDIQRFLLFKNLKDLGLLDFEIYGNGWLSGEDMENSIISDYSYWNKLTYQFKFVWEKGVPAYVRKLQQRKQSTPDYDSLEKHIRGPVDFQNYLSITKESLITLGVNRYPSYQYPFQNPNTYSRLRDIEAPMLGACYLTEWTDGLDEMYEVSEEIMIYKDEEELIEKISFLKKDKTLRQKMRSKGQQRALNDHSIPNSLRRIEKYFNLKRS